MEYEYKSCYKTKKAGDDFIGMAYNVFWFSFQVRCI